MVTRPTYRDKFIRDNVVAQYLQLSVVIVTLPGPCPSVPRDSLVKTSREFVLCGG